MPADFQELERDVLDCMRRHDRESLGRLLTESFVITTAGWITEPVGREVWLDQLVEAGALDSAVIRSVSTRSYDGCVVAFVLSSQTGIHRGEPFDMDFRYTDIWVPGPDGRWLLDVRHAGISARR